MQMHTALLGGPADPQTASKNTEESQIKAGGEIFASLVAAEEKVALPAQSSDIGNGEVNLQVTPSISSQKNSQKTDARTLAFPAAVATQDVASLRATEEPISEAPEPAFPPLTAEVTKDVIHTDTPPYGLLAETVEVSPTLEEKHLLPHQFTQAADPESPYLRGTIVDQSAIVALTNQAQPQLPANGTLEAILNPTARQHASVFPHSETSNSADTVTSMGELKTPAVETSSARPSLEPVLPTNAIDTVAVAELSDLETPTTAGSSDAAAAKLSLENPAPLGNPETPAALAKAFASRPSPEQATVTQAAALYQLGGNLVPTADSVPVPQLLAAMEPAALAAIQIEQLETKQPIASQQAIKDSTLSPEITMNSKSRPADELLVTNLASGMRTEPAAPNVQAPSAFAEAGAALDQSLSELARSPVTERLLTAENDTASPRTGPQVISAPQTASLEQSTPLLNQPRFADTAGISLISGEAIGPEPQSLGFSLPLSEVRAGSMAPISQALYTNPEVPQRVAQQMAEAARALSDRPVEISLNPEELGRVRMTMNATDGSMAVVLAVERSETLDLMRRHIDTLAAEFRALGYRDVSFSFGGQGQGDPSGEGQADGQTPGVGPAENEPAPMQNTPHMLALDGAGGMDIRL